MRRHPPIRALLPALLLCVGCATTPPPQQPLALVRPHGAPLRLPSAEELVETGLPPQIEALPEPDFAPDRTRVVRASAYNSVRAQTDHRPAEAAWGDRLEPGMKVIAVSRDLLREGLTRGVLVTIDGVPGEFRVLDKMGRRWRNKIDIYMGEDVSAARRWGVRQVRIRWPDSEATASSK